MENKKIHFRRFKKGLSCGVGPLNTTLSLSVATLLVFCFTGCSSDIPAPHESFSKNYFPENATVGEEFEQNTKVDYDVLVVQETSSAQIAVNNLVYASNSITMGGSDEYEDHKKLIDESLEQIQKSTDKFITTPVPAGMDEKNRKIIDALSTLSLEIDNYKRVFSENCDKLSGNAMLDSYIDISAGEFDRPESYYATEEIKDAIEKVSNAGDFLVQISAQK